MNYHRQLIVDALTNGAKSNGQARNWANDQLHRERQLRRDAYKIAERIERGGHVGLLPIEETPDGFQVIPILDCPRNWTPDRVAAFRELGRAILREMQANPKINRAIAGYISRGPMAWSYETRHERYRTLSDLGLGRVFK